MIRYDEAMAKDFKVDDFVTWNSSGGPARGKIQSIKREGKVNVPDSTFTLNASEDEPVALIRLFRPTSQGLAATGRVVGHRVSSLRVMPEGDMSMTKAVNADDIFLETLRKGIAADVSPQIWEVVEQQVAEVGVRGLTGSAAQFIKALVVKHGTHDQKEHGAWAGSGSGGSGGGGGEFNAASLDAYIQTDGSQARAPGADSAAARRSRQSKPLTIDDVRPGAKAPKTPKPKKSDSFAPKKPTTKVPKGERSEGKPKKPQKPATDPDGRFDAAILDAYVRTPEPRR